MWLAKNGVVVVVLCSPTDVLVCIYNKCVCVCVVCEFWLFYNTHTNYRQQIITFFRYFIFLRTCQLSAIAQKETFPTLRKIYIFLISITNLSLYLSWWYLVHAGVCSIRPIYRRMHKTKKTYFRYVPRYCNQTNYIYILLYVYVIQIC